MEVKRHENLTKIGSVIYAAEVVLSYLLMALWCLSVTHKITGA